MAEILQPKATVSLKFIDAKMPLVPTSITVARLPQQPAHKSDPRYQPEPKTYEVIETINVEIAPSSTSAAVAADMSTYATLRDADRNAMLYIAEKRQFQPKVSLQPDIRRYWSPDAWRNRAVVTAVVSNEVQIEDRIEVRYEVRNKVRKEIPKKVRNDRYHVLFTTSSDDNLTENRHVKGKVRGDIFVLRLSETVDKDGRRYYVDVKPRDLDGKSGSWEVLRAEVEQFMEVRGQFVAK